jgi:hypothetical protein
MDCTRGILCKSLVWLAVVLAPLEAFSALPVGYPGGRSDFCGCAQPESEEVHFAQDGIRCPSYAADPLEPSGLALPQSSCEPVGPAGASLLVPVIAVLSRTTHYHGAVIPSAAQRCALLCRLRR